MTSMVSSMDDRIIGHITAVRNVMDDPTVDKPTPSVPGPLLEAAYIGLTDLKKLFESKIVPPFQKKRWLRVIQDVRLKNRKGVVVDGIQILLDVLERLREHENIVLEACSCLTNILKYPSGAADVDRQRGKQILQICLKRWKDDEFIPLEAEYGLKQLKDQQSKIRELSETALKRAIENKSLSSVITMMDSNPKNRNICVPCLVGVLRIVDDDANKLAELRSTEAWMNSILKILENHNRVEQLMSSGCVLLLMIVKENSELRRQIAKNGAMGVVVRSIYVYAENEGVMQQLLWLLNELIFDRHNIRDFIVLNGDKAMAFYNRKKAKQESAKKTVLIPARLERLCSSIPRIREELASTGRFNFEMENFART